jgi:hypothetical protein
MEAARDWYTERSPAAEAGFVADLNHAVEQVTAAPHRWPRYRAKTQRYVFKRYPYCLVFRFSGDLIRVLAVAHDKQRVGYWSTRQ